MSPEMQRAIIEALRELLFGIPQTRTTSIAIYPSPAEQALAETQPEFAKSRTESNRTRVAQPQST